MNWKCENCDSTDPISTKDDCLVCENYIIKLKYEQEKEIRQDREATIQLLAEALKVSNEPHQTFFERLLEAAQNCVNDTIENCARIAEITPTTLCQNGEMFSERVAISIRKIAKN